MIDVSVKQADYSLQLGRRGENGVRALVFDFADWMDELGPGVVEIVARRPGEQTAYPVQSEQQGSTVRWIVSATDTACPGYGEAQLIYRIGGKVAKTRKYNTYTAESITWPEDVPGPDQQFLDQMLTMSATAKAGAERAEQAAGRSEQILTETAGLKEQTTVDRKAAEAAKDDATKQAQAAARQAEEADRQRQDAVTAAGQAQGAATAAGKSEGAAQEAAKKTGEDLLATTTAKETAEKAAQNAGDAAETAKMEADKAAQAAAESGYIQFYIDDDGYLVYGRTANVDVEFGLEEGELVIYAE